MAIKKRKENLTKAYLSTLGRVYKEDGLLAATGYEIKSTLYSLGQRIADMFDLGGEGERTRVDWRDYERKGYEVNAAAREAYEQNKLRDKKFDARHQDRKDKTRDYLLRARKEKNLATVSATASIFGLAGSIFFLSANITGNAIGNMTNSSTNIFGLSLFFVGLVSALVYFKKR